MKIIRKIIAISLSICCSILLSVPTFADTITTTKTINTSRLSGQSRYETAKTIAEAYNQGKVQNVILSTGNNFADALSASVLSHQKEAPILLADLTVNGSQDAFNYIIQHLDATGTVYIVGGTGVINRDFETKLNSLGFNNINRIAGSDRFDTSYQLAKSLNESTVSTVVISSGESYPDALSIASFAANKGWPILLSSQNALSDEMMNYLADKKPTKVYITGGSGVISDAVSASISSILPKANVERLSGQSRFDTNALIARTFASNPMTVYLATGFNFADALAGSTLAAKNGEPIIFVDPTTPTLPKAVADYFTKLNTNNLTPGLVTFGGGGTVTDDLIKNTVGITTGVIKEDAIYSIDDINEEVAQNQSYTLPTTVLAKQYNSETVDVPVKWNPSTVDTSTIGTSVCEGVVDGYTKPIKASVTVKDIEIEVKDKKVYLDKKVGDIISKIITPGMTDLQKELAIHDYLIKNTEYNFTPDITFDGAGNAIFTPNYDDNYTAYGVLINGKGKCEGYADAVNLLLNKAGIESQEIVGTINNGASHAWNIVKINGEYYHLDVTLDDDVYRVGYAYFNLSDNQISKDHKWEKGLCPACTKEFTMDRN